LGSLVYGSNTDGTFVFVFTSSQELLLPVSTCTCSLDSIRYYNSFVLLVLEMSKRKRYAILMGINDCQPQALNYCDTDVARLSARLVSICRFDAADVYPIMNTVSGPNDEIFPMKNTNHNLIG